VEVKVVVFERRDGESWGKNEEEVRESPKA